MLARDWIDIHAHFLPPEAEEVHHRRLHGLREGCWCIEAAPRWDVEAALSYMNRTGIAMQMLSNIPKTLAEIRISNDYGASLVRARPHRFGLLAALPTDDVEAAISEAERAESELDADGYAVSFDYNGVSLSDAHLDRLWEVLDRRKAVVFAHPNAIGPGSLGRPRVILEVAFESARTTVDMLYKGVFRRYPGIRFVVAHCGGALPALSGRLELIGSQPWVPNPEGITATEMRKHLACLFVDTAATMPTALGPALAMTGLEHIVYGSDCGVPCSTDATMDANIVALRDRAGLSADQLQFIGRNALNLFPKAAARIERQKPA
ncbi:amidohydrolase 2 [Streptomyces sp. AcH 505]|jgi:predicted TIM-barrel fold metal-dependent hydrolase|uniref:amidohydrolase family protein n=1 Tax=Streptomyces sp. AcH 505 TaxID=352211 RepID=UPI000591A693|nr:amidohydrolase 2 [Streptomyces sp. AcH 505]